MTELIFISKSRDNDCSIRIKKRLTELNELKVAEINKILEMSGIINPEKNSTKENSINDIVLHEKMLLGNKKTQIMITIDNKIKTYFVETSNNFNLITRKIIDNKEIYNVRNNLSYTKTHTEIIYEKKDKEEFRWKGFPNEDNLSLIKDVRLCGKAMMFIDSYHFYLKVKYLSFISNEFHDIIKNICFVYFERTLANISDLRCKLI